MDHYYVPASGREPCTLYQLKNLIQRSNVSTNVSSAYHADNDFIEIVTESLIVGAALHVLEVDSVCNIIANEETLNYVADNLVDSYVLNDIKRYCHQLHCDATNNCHMCNEGYCNDDLHTYVCQVLFLGMLLILMKRTTEAGDGERCLMQWKICLIIYHAVHKVKYRLESFLTMVSQKCILPSHLAFQLKHNRFINLSGGEGKNLDGDYTIELFNRVAKQRISRLGPNHTPDVIKHIGQTINFTNDLEKHMCVQTYTSLLSRTKTNKKKADSDMHKIVTEIINTKPFAHITNRTSSAFDFTSCNIFRNFNANNLKEFINDNKTKYSVSKLAY